MLQLRRTGSVSGSFDRRTRAKAEESTAERRKARAEARQEREGGDKKSARKAGSFMGIGTEASRGK